jgi:hypothetical protein
MATTAQRNHLHALMDFLYAHRSQLDYPYDDVRTTRDAASWLLAESAAERLLHAGGRMQMDCSQCCAWLLKAVGCWHWSEPGYTGSHLKLMPTYHDARGAEVGALVVFGGGTGHHEAMVYRPDPHGGNPLLASHGRPGYDLVTLRDEEASQTREGYPGVRLLSIAHL